MSEIPGFDLGEFVQRVLAEDLGSGGDVTSAATISADARFGASMNCREPIVVAGLEIAIAFFRALDPDVAIEKLAEDGAAVGAGTVLLRLQGNARAMLTAERSALNTLQHLSGIATLTRRYVDAIAGTGATLLDTRKTIPGLRALEKYAARMGGAENHRMRLDDGAPRLGWAFAGRSGVGPVGFTDSMLVCLWEPPGSRADGRGARFRVVKTGRLLGGWVDVTIEPHGAGSRLDWREDVVVRPLPLKRAFSPVLSRVAVALYGRALDAMVARAEAAAEVTRLLTQPT